MVRLGKYESIGTVYGIKGFLTSFSRFLEFLNSQACSVVVKAFVIRLGVQGSNL